MKRICIVGLLAVVAISLLAPSKTLSQGDEEKKQEVSSLPLAVSIKVKPRLVAYLKVRQTQAKGLAVKYGKVIDARLNKAADAGDLRVASAFKGEKERLASLDKAFAEELEDPVIGVRKGAQLPDLDAEAPEALVALRKIWTTEWQKIRAKLDGELQRSLKKIETDWTKVRDFKNAEVVMTFRESLLSVSPTAKAEATDSDQAPAPTSAMKGGSSSADSATKEKPFENSLGMNFVPVPITGGPSDGKRVLFSIWETRVKDYEAFIRKNRSRYWADPGFKQKSDHPAVNASWEDAVAFCAWLTDTEREKGTIGKDQVYRLPTDHEWSCAVGIGAEEDAGATPSSKTNGHAGVYPWGTGFPPSEGAGNYYGEEMEKNPVGTASKLILGYKDRFDRTSPAGSFVANELGLFDLGGNVWEWCDDDFTTEERRVARGGSWSLFNGEKQLRSAHRDGNTPSFKFISFGFRIVLAGP